MFVFQRDLVDFGVSGLSLWASWGSGLGGAALGPAAAWRKAPSAPAPPPDLLQKDSHVEYAERLFSPGLFPMAVIAKALSVSYNLNHNGSKRHYSTFILLLTHYYLESQCYLWECYVSGTISSSSIK